MKTTALMAAMSHLSDAQALLKNLPEQANQEINYAKRIMLKFSANLDQLVDTEDITKLLLDK